MGLLNYFRKGVLLFDEYLRRIFLMVEWRIDMGMGGAVVCYSRLLGVCGFSLGER